MLRNGLCNGSENFWYVAGFAVRRLLQESTVTPTVFWPRIRSPIFVHLIECLSSDVSSGSYMIWNAQSETSRVHPLLVRGAGFGFKLSVSDRLRQHKRAMTKSRQIYIGEGLFKKNKALRG
ncbi:hypothetical protein CC78DRAFT_580577 [Lojkania enalia]|uniref:Uncharacterized protein n=1 Tax=Lojkania enalia TaxID=147567 RepID=A0A9P4K9G6_9PLEO|nr:hypothetical protein CC78DRAFT_580577 [Didymosphaeria enalia]